MATASRTRQPVGPKHRPRGAAIAARTGVDVSTWAIPAAAGVGIIAAVLLTVTGVVPLASGLGATVLGALVLLLYIGLRPLVTESHSARDRALGAALGAVWLLACYLPFHLRLVPGTPLVAEAALETSGRGLPLRIPAAGHHAIDLLLGGKLAPAPAGGLAPPLHYHLSIEGADGQTRVIEGTFEDTLRTRRMGRRGTAVVHHLHTEDFRVLANPAGGDLTVTQLTLEPENAQPVTLSAFPHPLPGGLVLGLAVVTLLAATVAFDRLGPVTATDGALTLATAAVVGTAVIFWTSDAVHPDFQTFIGSAIFGGPVGFAAGALVWWIAKRLIAPRTLA